MEKLYFKNVFFVKENRETICKLPWDCQEIVESKLFPTIGGTFQLELYCTRACKTCSQLHFMKGSRDRLNISKKDAAKRTLKKSAGSAKSVDEKKLAELWKKKGTTLAGIADEFELSSKQVLVLARKLNLLPRKSKKLPAK